MKTTIGPFDVKTGQVTVTFDHKGITHQRGVNACLTAAGKVDPKATKARVAEVANGVECKIDLGVITNPPPEPEVTEPEAPADAE